ncbi:MAG TPA: hypothetical protein VF792_01455 [Ktedonobacterales bacterium]
MPIGEPPHQPSSQDPADSDITLRVSALGQSSPRNPAVHQLPGARVWTIAATSLLVGAVLVGLFLRATNDPRGAIGTLLQIPTPTPAPTIAPSGDALYFANAVPWGTLTIDNKRLSNNNLITHEFNGIILSRGRHQLVYQARYFPTLRCTLSVPQAPADTCPLDTTTGATARQLTGEAGRTIDLGASLDRLSADQRDALSKAITVALQAQALSATIAPGDRYLDPQGDIATASEPLTLTLTLSTHPRLNPGDCNPFCPDNTAVIPGLGVDNLWHIQTALYAEWTITDASGQSLGAVDDQHGGMFVTPGNNSVNNLSQIGVTLTTSGWQVSGLDGLTQQAAITAQENTVNQAIFQHLGASGFAMGGRVIGLASNPLQGCFVIISPPDGYRNVTIVARFGAAFVIDDAGHPVYSQMEHANDTEVNVMNTLIQQGVPQTSF